MIKINDQMSIKKYKYGWELHHKTPSKDKKGNDSTSTRVTYHPNIKKTLSAIVDRTAGESKELSEMIGDICRLEGSLIPLIDEIACEVE